MKLAPAILAALRGASEPLSNVAIREQIAELEDLEPVVAQHLVADEINKLVQADHVERVWDQGRCTYVIAPNAQAIESVGADPGIEVGATRHSGDPLPAPAPAAPAPPPPTNQAAIAMPKSTSDIQHKILDILTIANAPMKKGDINKRMPKISAPVLKQQLRLLVESKQILASGSTSARIYRLPGMPLPDSTSSAQRVPVPPEIGNGANSAKQSTPATAPSDQSRVAEAPPAPAKSPSAVEAVVGCNSVPMARVPIADLRAAASDILLSHGGEQLPIALHRLVIAALGAPESLAA